MNRPELSFDGCGINGPDEYRTRIATFAKVRGPDAMKYGPLFAAAPEMLRALETALTWMKTYQRQANTGPNGPLISDILTIEELIAKAKGGTQ